MKSCRFAVDAASLIPKATTLLVIHILISFFSLDFYEYDVIC